jgi:hypothetical protein
MTRVTRYAGIFETENRGQPVARCKGRMSPKTIERDFPHVVEIAVPPGGLGAQLDAMHYFHGTRGIKACLGRGRREDNLDYLRWYFTSRTTAAAFAAEFGGTYLRAPTKNA